MPVQSQIDAANAKIQAFKQAALTKYQHNAADLHLIGETIGPPSRVSNLVIGGNGSLGVSPYPAREDHVHGIPAYSFGSYTPAISATTPPADGTGVSKTGWFFLFGNLLYWEWQITFGTGGGGGAGNWSFNIPNSANIQTQIPSSILSSFRAVDSSAGGATTQGQVLTAATPGTNYIVRSYNVPNTGGVTWGAAQPFGVAWAAGDSISGSVLARIA